MIDFSLLIDSLPDLLNGALISLQIAFLASLLGICLGTSIALIESSQNRVLRFFAFLYTNLFRGTPMLVQILFVFYVLPITGMRISPLFSVVLAIGMNSGAYLSQVIRTGFNAIPKGQAHAAISLGFTRYQSLRYITLPQTFRKILPALGNELSTLLKDSSLASVIGVVELAKAGSIIRGRTYDAFTVLLAVTLIYLTMTFILSTTLKYLEKRSARPCSW